MLCGGRLDLGKGVKSHHCITHHITSGSQFWEVPVQNPDPTSDTSHRRNSSLHSIVSLHCFTASLHNLPQIYSSGSWCECYNKIYSLSSRKPCLILMIYNEIKILNRTYLSSVIYLYIYIYTYIHIFGSKHVLLRPLYIYIYIYYTEPWLSIICVIVISDWRSSTLRLEIGASARTEDQVSYLASWQWLVLGTLDTQWIWAARSSFVVLVMFRNTMGKTWRYTEDKIYIYIYIYIHTYKDTILYVYVYLYINMYSYIFIYYVYTSNVRVITHRIGLV